MITSINELFVLVPKGSGSKFEKVYAKTDKYKSKIAFVEDTGEIWTNGQAFGLNNADDVNALQVALTDLQTQVTLDISTAIAQEVSDRNQALEDLKETILGLDVSTAFDTLKEVENWITAHGTEAVELIATVNDISTRVDALEVTDTSLNALISDEVTRAKAKEDELAGYIDDIANASVWEEFSVDADAPEIGDDTLVLSTASDVVTAATETPEDKDVVVTSDDAMTYFQDSTSATFKNITL